MGTKRRVRAGLWAGAITLATLVAWAPLRAGVTTERPGSILILPKVVADGVRDTVIEITNTSNILVHAKCYYINGAPLNPELPAGPTNPPLWQEVDFDIWLTRQQPTHWVAGDGRRVNPLDALGTPGAGLDPGFVPAAPSGFAGELICVQVDDSGNPVPGNALIGNATLQGPGSDIARYNAIGILGNNPDSNFDLMLDNAEYGACPAGLQFPHIAQGAEDPVLGTGSYASGRLTLAPCAVNLEDSLPARVSVSVQSYDELEQLRSGQFEVDCWYDRTLDLASLGNPALFFSDSGFYKYSRLTPGPVCSGGAFAGNPCNPQDPQCGTGTCDGVVGIVGVYESTQTDA